jgi:hypothetical protein
MNYGVIIGYLFVIAGVIYFYFLSPDFKTQVDEWNEHLQGAAFEVFGINFSILDLATSVYVCMIYRSRNRSPKAWNEVVAATVAFQFGGTIFQGILLGRPPLFLRSTQAFPGYLLAYFLVFNFPSDLFYNAMNSKQFGWLGRLVIGILSSISMGHAIGSWGVDQVYFTPGTNEVSKFGKYFVLNILVGSFTVSGGGILTDALQFLHPQENRSFTLCKTPGIFGIERFDASAGFNRGFWLSLIYYYYLCNAQQAGDLQSVRIQGHSILGILFIGMYFIQRQVDFDPFWLFTRFLTGVTLTNRVVYPDYHLHDKDE